MNTKGKGEGGDKCKSRKVILFLAANPIHHSRLAFEEECAAIERELRMTDARDEFEFRPKFAVTVDEMMRHLNELQPTVIHFSAHGQRPGQGAGLESSPPKSRDVGRRRDPGADGLYLQDDRGNPLCISVRALRKMLGAAAASARVVVLNACYSGRQANALRGVVECVVGMKGAIRDDAARSFAVGFYRALGNRRSIGNAVQQAVAILSAVEPQDASLPCCCTRKGIDPGQIFLTEAVSRRRGSAGRAPSRGGDDSRCPDRAASTSRAAMRARCAR